MPKKRPLNNKKDDPKAVWFVPESNRCTPVFRLVEILLAVAGAHRNQTRSENHNEKSAGDNCAVHLGELQVNQSEIRCG